jgi:hypothetical protein
MVAAKNSCNEEIFRTCVVYFSASISIHTGNDFVDFFIGLFIDSLKSLPYFLNSEDSIAIFIELPEDLSQVRDLILRELRGYKGKSDFFEFLVLGEVLEGTKVERELFLVFKVLLHPGMHQNLTGFVPFIRGSEQAADEVFD